MGDKGAGVPLGATWADGILESIAEGVFTVDHDWRITFFNRAAEQITGMKREEARGRYCFEVFKASICEQGCCLRETLVTGRAEIHRAAYILRPDGKRVPISISTGVLRDPQGNIVGGVETFRDLSVVETLRKELKKRFSFGDIVTKNEKLHAILGILPQVGSSDATVLIEGESGTGKELFARAIYAQSGSSRGPWVAVNCAALPDNLLESELFGHVAGVFTGAVRNRAGRFAAAHGGTIFLDEIGDISPALQVRLLRVLQEKTIEPLGTTEVKRVDVRVIAASNKELAPLVAAGELRDDLYYRLKVVTLRVPPLRERRDDIPLLVEHFIDRFNHVTGGEVSHMDPTALGILMAHDFPGNVRELSNIVEHAFVLGAGGVLLPEHLPDYLRPEGTGMSERPKTARPLDHLEAEVIREVLARHDYNRAATARELGIHKTTLWRKMKKLGIPVPR